MHEWIYAIQRMIDWIDEHACENPSLAEISKQIGYSPYYCSEQFHKIAGMTIREYMAKRRLTMAAIALRDTDMPIVEVALRYGFSDQTVIDAGFSACIWMRTVCLSKKSCSTSAYLSQKPPAPFQKH